MKVFQGKVTQLLSGSAFADKQPRLQLRIEGADSLYCDVRLPNTLGLTLDQSVEILIQPLHPEEADVAHG